MNRVYSPVAIKITRFYILDDVLVAVAVVVAY